MKTNYSLIKKVSLLFVAIILTSASVFAASYTAVVSGSWSSSATWGISAPAPDITLDQVVIPAGITVTMDNNVTVSGALATLDVQGTLNSASNLSLTVGTLGIVTGIGSINVGNVVLNTGANLLFTGSMMANTVTSAALTLQMAADMVVNQTLTLAAGTLSIDAGGSLDLASNGTIIISGGILSLTGGTLGLSGNYNVIYNSGAATAGLELTGSGLTDVTIDVSNGNMVTLTSGLIVNGTLTLQSGILELNGNDLTITAAGDVSASGIGTILSTATSSISVNTAGGISGSLDFNGSSAVNNLTINVGAGNQVQVGGNLIINGTLALTTGILSFSSAGLTIDGSVSGSGFLSGNTASNLTISTSGGLSGMLSFATGGQAINNLTIDVGSGNAVTLGSNLTIGGTLALSGESNLNITGVTVTLGANGNITGSGLLIVNTSSGLVINATSGISTAVSFAGTIGDLTVNVSNGNNVMLGSDLTVAGILTLQSGTLVLNGYDLTITASADIAASGNGAITSTAVSNITINAPIGINGTLAFSGSSAVNNFTINVGAGNQAQIGGNLTVDGTLSLNTGILNFSSAGLTVDGSVSGSGTLSSNASSNLTVSTAGGLSGTLLFTAGAQTVNNFTVAVGAGNTVTVGSDLTVAGTLNLSSGSSLNISGQSLTIGVGGTISGSGSLTTDAGSSLIINAGSGIATPIIISGGIIGGLEVNVGGSNSVVLGGDLTVAGTLDLQSGTLVLNGFDLMVMGDIAAGGTGNISSTATSNITINTGTSPSGGISFNAAANTVNNFIVNIGAGGALVIDSDLEVAGTLNFIGGSINVGSNGLTIGASGTITGAGSASYVITGVNGFLAMQLTAGSIASTSFPVGTMLNFAPAEIQLNTGSASGEVQVGVNADVLAEGTSGIDVSANQPVVDATWFISSDITANLNMDMEVMWSAAMEANAFARTIAYISHYMNGNWDVAATASATAEANGMFSLQRTGITSLSPFAVFDQNTITSIAEKNKEVQFQVFPNPATDYIMVKNISGTRDEVINITVTDVLGETLANYTLTIDNDVLYIPLNELASGNYFLRATNEKINAVKRFHKL